MKKFFILSFTAMTVIFLVLSMTGCKTEKQYKALQQTNSDLLSALETASNTIQEMELNISNTLTNMTAEMSNLESTHQQLEEQLKTEIKSGEIEIQKIKDVLTLNIADRLFFDSGKADIKPAGEAILLKVADILKKIPEKVVKIEGHTDNVPISHALTNRFASNWELSAARATTVVRFLQDKGDISPERLSATGYADVRPIASNRTAKGRARNRRIEIVLADRQLYQVMELKKGIDTKK